MKGSKFFSVVLSCCLIFSLASCSKKNTADKKIKIGIAKIVQHVALDSVEQGIIDVLKENNVDAEFDLQNANGDVNTATQIAMKYRDENVDVAVGIATPVALALANTIKDIPIVFGTVTDPVGVGLVSSLDKGEGNVTGMSDAIPTKQHIATFKEIAGIKTLGYIYTSNEANSVSSLKLVEQACKEQGLNLVTQSISNSSEVRQAAEAIIDKVDGIYLTTDNTVFSALSRLMQVFEKNKNPVFSGDVTGVKEGGCLMASGFNYYKAGRATGEMVLEILNGKKPEELPVRFMTDPKDTDLLIDLDSSKNCGIVIPESYINDANMIFQNGKLEEK